MVERYALVVNLWIEGQEAAFEVFERDAARRMAKHGGRIDMAVRTAPPGELPGAASATPYEIHVVSFPDKAAADAHAADPATQTLLEQRATIIALTTVMPGSLLSAYG